MKKAVLEARQRAITLMGENWSKREAPKWRFLMALRPEVVSQFRPALEKLARELPQLDTRQRILIAYLNVIHNRNRFPYVREIQSYIKDQWGVTIDKRIIRRICDELPLPRTSERGRPQKN